MSCVCTPPRSDVLTPSRPSSPVQTYTQVEQMQNRMDRRIRELEGINPAAAEALRNVQQTIPAVAGGRPQALNAPRPDINLLSALVKPRQRFQHHLVPHSRRV